MSDDLSAGFAEQLNECRAGEIFLLAASTAITDSDGDSYDGRHDPCWLEAPAQEA
jgi:hypothetical protein